MRRLGISAGVIVVTLASLVQAMPASAYVATQACSSASASQTTVLAGQPVTLTATFKGGTGCAQPDVAQTVNFTQQSGPAGCTATISPTSATTNSSGVATTTVTLPAKCPGSFVLAASEVNGVTVTVTLVESGGFPNSTTDPPAPSPTMPVWLILAGVLAAVTGTGALALRKLRS